MQTNFVLGQVLSSAIAGESDCFAFGLGANLFGYYPNISAI